MGEQLCQVMVNNVSENAKRYIVARWSKDTSSLWYYGSWDNEAQANEIAKLVDGVVVINKSNDRTAKWEYYESDLFKGYRCSKCLDLVQIQVPYCRMCGRRMKYAKRSD